jgi:hypothetical protein
MHRDCYLIVSFPTNGFIHGQIVGKLMYALTLHSQLQILDVSM